MIALSGNHYVTTVFFNSDLAMPLSQIVELVTGERYLASLDNSNPVLAQMISKKQ